MWRLGEKTACQIFLGVLKPMVSGSAWQARRVQTARGRFPQHECYFAFLRSQA